MNPGEPRRADILPQTPGDAGMRKKLAGFDAAAEATGEESQGREPRKRTPEELAAGIKKFEEEFNKEQRSRDEKAQEFIKQHGEELKPKIQELVDKELSDNVRFRGRDIEEIMSLKGLREDWSDDVERKLMDYVAEHILKIEGFRQHMSSDPRVLEGGHGEYAFLNRALFPLVKEGINAKAEALRRAKTEDDIQKARDKAQSA